MSLPETGYGFTVSAKLFGISVNRIVSNSYNCHKIFVRGHSQVEKCCKIIIIILILSPENRYMTTTTTMQHQLVVQILAALDGDHNATIYDLVTQTLRSQGSTHIRHQIRLDTLKSSFVALAAVI